MIKKIVLLLAFFTITFVVPQDINELFSKANDAYKNGEFQKAIELYEQIATTGNVSADLYYNLGNSYYKINKVGPSIYNYERALQLDPSHQDTKNNLVFAKRLSLDRIEDLPKSIFQTIKATYFDVFSFNQWAIISVFFSFLAAFLFLLYYFAHNPASKRFYFSTSIISTILLIFTFFITLHQYNTSSKAKEAIVYASEVSVKNEPIKNADEAFIIHEGTKVVILDQVDDWKKIKLADGKIGWLKNYEISDLINF
jgi:tetratricopeptide (TPR) repeat protein